MRARGAAGRGSVGLVVFLAATVTITGFVVMGLAAPAKNPVAGGGPAKSDCYSVFDVQGATSITKNKIVTCMDGDPCDTDGMCDGTCTFKVALCPNQTGISGCTPSPPLSSITVKGKASLTPPTDLSGSDCGPFSDVKVTLKGKKKTAKATIHVVAKDPTGKPKVDNDTLVLKCTKRVGTCPPPTTTTTTMPSPPVNLGLGCLYIGGGGATVIPPSLIPDGATNFFNVSGTTLTASVGDGTKGTCSKAPGPGKHCINNHCNTDADCDGTPGSCQGAINCVTGTQANPLPCADDNACGGAAGTCGPDANCFFGPPLPILSPPPNGALTTCVLNVFSADASGTGDTTAGTSTVMIPLASRVYITGNTTSPCPKCISATCTYGENAGKACTTTTNLMTSLACPPPLKGFQAPLPVTLGPLTSGPAQMSAANGSFCPNQTNPGAFGHPSVKQITENGMAAGNLADNAPHHGILAAVFCIPPTGNVAVDGVADLPGPGAIGLNGMARLTGPAETPPNNLSFTTSAGTLSCGGAGLNPAPGTPSSGMIQ